MRPHRFVVFGDWLKGFDTLDAAREYARANVPSVICERFVTPDGASQLREVLRHDYLYDEASGEWRFMESDVGAAACRES